MLKVLLIIGVGILSPGNGHAAPIRALQMTRSGPIVCGTIVGPGPVRLPRERVKCTL